METIMTTQTSTTGAHTSIRSFASWCVELETQTAAGMFNRLETIPEEVLRVFFSAGHSASSAAFALGLK